MIDGDLENRFSVEDDDGVCFSAGLTGAPFGAGTIHAYLASDRQPPKIAAGISLGALTAAAMERSYRGLAKSRTESARWTWYRRYLKFLLDRPFDVVWDSIPNPSDLLADLPPVKDTALPANKQGERHPTATRMEVEARRKLYVVSRVGSWLAHLPVRVSSVAWLLVRYVRNKERYPKFLALQIWNWISFGGRLLATMWSLLVHTARPFFIFESAFRLRNRQLCQDEWYVRPLFGWAVWLVSLAAASAALLAAGFILWDLTGHALLRQWPPVDHLLAFVGVALFPLVALLVAILPARLRHEMLNSVLRKLCLDRSLLSEFPLIRRMHALFEADGGGTLMKDCHFPVLLVTAPLQLLPESNRAPGDHGPNQLWARPNCSLPIAYALQASLAEPPWFPPLRVNNQRCGFPLHAWYDGSEAEELDLVDGAAVRHNPLPALFGYLKSAGQDAQQLADKLNCVGARVHLVYDVPILWKPEETETGVDPKAPEPPMPNIVKTAFGGLRLANRRDSRQEVVRTNRISEIERTLRTAGLPADRRVQTVTVDEIAPPDELIFRNQLNPTETEMLTHIATGCRQTLSALYMISQETERGPFLRQKAHRRGWVEVGPTGAPGLSEVCRHCTQTLSPLGDPPKVMVPASFSAGSGKLAQCFPNLTGETPRIVFLAQGGVFRGSFHIGMAGAMLATGIKPDMIVGASVGTLIGAMLASILSAKEKHGEPEARKRLCELTDLFLQVDDQAALTKTFKAAMKDLGIRGRSTSLRLSPNEVRKMVQRGSRKDAGIAATGAPPAMIDAISDLFLIPYRRTAGIAAEFVAGHFSKAISDFWKQISTETIDRLGIHDAVLGADLIEERIRYLLRDDLEGRDDPFDQLQPFLRRSGIALFATTVNLVTEAITILGAELNLVLDRKSYDFIEALLASSAFPAAFAPRRASNIYPGTGRRDMFYGDGGMFDNLPAIPAFEILGEIQKDRLRGSLGNEIRRSELRRRYESPDLFIVGSLEARIPLGKTSGTQKAGKAPKNPPDEGNVQRGVLDMGSPDPSSFSGGPYNTGYAAARRSGLLSNNEKIYGFRRAAEKLDRQLSRLASQAPAGPVLPPITKSSESFLNGIVNAGFMAVFPHDAEHLNGTFEFCKSLGMKRIKVQRSIADGCFQMLNNLRINQAANGSGVLDRALAAANLAKVTSPPAETGKGNCPYFQIRGSDFRCPFENSDGIYEVCAKDSVHRELLKIAGKKN